jgi:hypothetical protein
VSNSHATSRVCAKSVTVPAPAGRIKPPPSMMARHPRRPDGTFRDGVQKGWSQGPTEGPRKAIQFSFVRSSVVATPFGRRNPPAFRYLVAWPSMVAPTMLAARSAHSGPHNSINGQRPGVRPERRNARRPPRPTTRREALQSGQAIAVNAIDPRGRLPATVAREGRLIFAAKRSWTRLRGSRSKASTACSNF